MSADLRGSSNGESVASIVAKPAPGSVDSAHQRRAGLDALRAAMTLLVVFHHTAITYGAIGGWFYKEVLPNGTLSSKLLVFFCTFNQAFFMGLFFLLAGYFTPSALKRRGAWRYLQDRFIRLGIPLLLFGWVLGPLTIALAQTAHDKPFLDTLFYLWRHGEFERGPLWFCQALLLFACGAVIWDQCVRLWRQRSTIEAVTAPLSAAKSANATVAVTATSNAATATGEVPGSPSNTHLLLAALLTGAAAFALRFWWPVGTQWWGLQLGYFAGYVVLFCAGYAAARTRWLENLSEPQVHTWRRVARYVTPVLPVLAIAAPAIPALQGPAEGGWHVLAAAYAFWEPLVAWGVILGLLWRFQHWAGAASPMWRALADRAYTIFIIHAPVVVAVSLAWRHVDVNPLLKFIVTGTVSCWLSYLIAGVLLRLARLPRPHRRARPAAATENP